MVHSRPRHVWIDDTHYVEVSDRRVEEGNHYYDPNGEGMFLRVDDIIEADRDVPEYIDIENAGDEVTVEILYTVGSNSDAEGMRGGAGSDTATLPRYVLETEQAISMGDLATIPFEKQ